MRFMYGGETYRLEFQRTWEDVAVPGQTFLTTRRPRTPALLHGEVVSPKPGEPEQTERTFVEVGHASVRFYHRDPQETREQGRRLAVRRLCPFLHPELRPLVW